MNNVQFAINMELEGRKYYLEQAELNKENELHTVFTMLADSEKDHAELLRRYRNDKVLDLSDSFIRPEFRSVFRDLTQFAKGHSAKQLEAYRVATEQEEKSIELYQNMLTEAEGPQDVELFEFLIKQEQEHLILFEELVKLVTRPEEWVESAEFGIREDY